MLHSGVLWGNHLELSGSLFDYCAAVCCTALHCVCFIVLYCIALCCIVWNCVVLHCVVVCPSMWSSTVFCCVVFHYIVLYSMVVYWWIKLHCVILLDIVWYCTLFLSVLFTLFYCDLLCFSVSHYVAFVWYFVVWYCIVVHIGVSGLILHGGSICSLGYFPFQPVVSNWSIKGCGICCPSSGKCI